MPSNLACEWKLISGMCHTYKSHTILDNKDLQIDMDYTSIQHFRLGGGMQLFIHSQTSTVEPLKFGNG